MTRLGLVFLVLEIYRMEERKGNEEERVRWM
jgi:hypothetical protein